jgi:hypothetical protein
VQVKDITGFFGEEVCDRIPSFPDGAGQRLPGGAAVVRKMTNEDAVQFHRRRGVR